MVWGLSQQDTMDGKLFANFCKKQTFHTVKHTG